MDEREDHEVTEEERSLARSLRDRLGLPEAARCLGVSTSSLLRVLAGSAVRRGTVALLRQRLEALARGDA